MIAELPKLPRCRSPLFLQFGGAINLWLRVHGVLADRIHHPLQLHRIKPAQIHVECAGVQFQQQILEHRAVRLSKLRDPVVGD